MKNPQDQAEGEGGEEESTSLLAQDAELDFKKFTQNFSEDQEFLGQHPELDYFQGKHGDAAFRLLDEALEDIGLGKFQYIVLGVCSYGAFVDAAESSVIALLLPQLRSEWGVTESQAAVIGSVTAIGQMTGALFFGWLSDTYGRRLSFQISLSICALFGFCSSFASTVAVFASMRFFLGFGYGGNLVASTSLLIETTPNEWRGVFLSIAGIAFGIGALFSTGIAWVIVPSIGWQWLLRIIALVSIPVIIVLFFVPESPRFLIMTAKYDAAVREVSMIAVTNGKEILPRFNSYTLRAAGGEFGPGNEHLHPDIQTQNAHIWFRNSKLAWKQITKKFVLVSLVPLAMIWFCNAFASTISFVIPMEISKEFPNDVNAPYKSALVMACGDLIGCFLTLYMTIRFYRITLLRTGTLLSSILTFGMAAANSNSKALFATVFLMQAFEQITVNTLYLYSPEVFPTGIRVRAFGVCMLFHRLAPIMSPYALAALDDDGFFYSCITMACIYLLAFGITFFLHVETYNALLVEDDSTELMMDNDDHSEKTTTKKEMDVAGSSSSSFQLGNRPVASSGYKEQIRNRNL